MESRRLLTELGFVRHSLLPNEVPLVREVETADIDGDGDLDIVRAGFGITWHENEGAGAFDDIHFVSGVAEEVTDLWFDESFRIRALSVDDIDADGDVDVVALRRNGEIAWYENRDGAGRFEAKRVIAQEGPPHSRDFWRLNLADIDGDGDLDLLSQVGTRLSWFRNDGVDRLFTGHTLREDAFDFEVVDFDGDRDLDVLYTQRGVTGWFENTDGQGSLSSSRLGVGAGGSLTSGDADGDGDRDLAVGNRWFENVDGQYQGREFMLGLPFGGPNVHPLIMLDADGDGENELFARLRGDLSEAEEFGLFNFRDGTFHLESYFGHAYIQGFATGDLDGDGDVDAIAAFREVHPENPTVQAYAAWFENRDGLTIVNKPRMVAVTSFAEQDTALFDPDGDGDLDVLTVSLTINEFYDQRLSWYENLDGKGTLSSENVLSDDHRSGTRHDWSAMPADLDGDGRDDVMTNQQRSEIIGWFRSGDDGFDAWKQIGRGAVIAPVDFDGDLDTDILYHAGQSVGFFENIGDGKFTVRSKLHAFNGHVEFAQTTDVDRDGDPDLLMGLGSDSIFWVENDGSGALVAEHPLTFPSDNYEVVEVDDLDGDGYDDLLLGKPSEKPEDELVWYRNDHAGGFQTEISIGACWSDAYAVRVVDMDGDGDRDVFLSTEVYGRQTSAWYENSGDAGRFVEREVHANVIQPLSASFGDLDGDGDVDFVGAGAWYEARPIGDVNGDGRFDSADLVRIFQVGKYEDGIPNNASFDEGDWNGDGDFTSADLVLAFKAKRE